MRHLAMSHLTPTSRLTAMSQMTPMSRLAVMSQLTPMNRLAVMGRLTAMRRPTALHRPAFVTALVAVLSLPLISCATGAGSSRSQAADEAAIADFNKRYLGAINDGDIATLSSLTTEEHIMIAPGRPPTVGKKANDEANGRAFTMFDIDETWTPQETVIDGDLAYQRGTFTVEATPKAGGNKTRTSGTFLRIYRRQPDGSWRMTRDMFNSDQPPNRNASPPPAQ